MAYQARASDPNPFTPAERWKPMPARGNPQRDKVKPPKPGKHSVPDDLETFPTVT